MKSVKHTALSMVFTAVVLSAGAQDIHFSQFQQAPLLVNPANAGAYAGNERLILNYKSQWMALGNLYKTYALSFDMPLFKGKRKQGFLGAGLNFYKDKAGDSEFGQTKAALSLSGIVPFNDQNRLSLGLQGGFVQRSGTITNLQWGTQYNGFQYDPNLPSNEANTINSFVNGDVAAGIMYEFVNSRIGFGGDDLLRINAGISCYHVNKPQFKYVDLRTEAVYRTWIGHASMRFDIPGSSVSLVPSLAHYIQGPSSETNIGSLFRFRIKRGTKITGLHDESAISFGCHYRLNDAVIPQVYLEISDFALGISYDVNASDLSEVTGSKGGIEISLKYVDLNGAIFKQK